ncbi:sigma-54 dependent DNA-binding response regulator [Myxococcus xanthus DK 1622]|uniref:Sigma-54 dependent DNA-binding response regulator n=1 Tax=Myxococcus xanthus (strain DK1622) TaxID=246197 RepID=Q1DDS5_MYXXD|nr:MULTISPECIES: sigma-54 dependent transcriptional regulator [Myxococcus]ABF92417.1 sigma-54 dependent DNA-binding response regulator [Myxococcus xanthus DK 1622]NOJ57137.1 sigma-54-dependent Fis family transcriptional regulator [Myxococcus xanthus]QPM80599.1 sigma-54-dependent Fis family transcriptional regulator [Myxococcus xanthus]QVW69660.1 sigma-54-dependent Fis family transcriptional regulator [Myxococcus xanthus DZ2]QZZ48466.1 Regulatory protein AtoC [Myxococcus xanthus]
MPGRVLVVEDEREMRAMLEKGLTRRGFTPVALPSADEALVRLAAEDFDVVLTDLRMPGMDGLALCERIALNRPDIPVVVVTAFGSLETAVAAIRAGAYDFVTKPIDVDALVLVLERAVQHRALREEVRRLRQELGRREDSGTVVGESPAMKQAYALIDRVADLDSTVLITGESGTGKEVAARAVHTRGRRKDGPFVAINCAAMPEALLESELFGHAKGAFTDAKAARTGLFVQANGGTLFLDEVGELPLTLQPKLLRALQERTVRPVGGDTELPFDARIVAATNRDLELAVEEDRFREDLYYRLNVIGVELPPLRARGNDVLALSQRFIEQFASRTGKRVLGLSPAAAQRLLAYGWPGNVRELQNCLERAVALTSFEEITVDDLPERVRNYSQPRVVPETQDASELVTLEQLERRYIHRVLEAVGGSRTLAARILGVDRKTLYRKLERDDDTRKG